MTKYPYVLWVLACLAPFNLSQFHGSLEDWLWPTIAAGKNRILAATWGCKIFLELPKKPFPRKFSPFGLMAVPWKIPFSGLSLFHSCYVRAALSSRYGKEKRGEKRGGEKRGKEEGRGKEVTNSENCVTFLWLEADSIWM